VTLVAAAMLYLAAFQSCALLALYRQKPGRTAVGVGCGVMLLFSCAAPALTSSVLAGLRALGAPSRILNVFALNPGLMLQYVANGHNDLIAIAPLVFATAVVRKRATLAFGSIAIAGLIKAPFVLLGLPIVAAVRSVRLRVAGSIAAFVAVAVISWLGAGNGYFKTLAEYGAKNVAPFVPLVFRLGPSLCARAATHSRMSPRVLSVCSDAGRPVRPPVGRRLRCRLDSRAFAARAARHLTVLAPGAYSYRMPYRLVGCRCLGR
jgi:hypothetical protein